MVEANLQRNVNYTRNKKKKGGNSFCMWRCGSALFYACIHHRTEEDDTPILIEFEADIGDMWVDGRDFFYTVIGLWDRLGVSQERKRRVEEILVTTFGRGVIKYFEKASTTPNPGRRIALMDLAINNHKIIRDHAKNKH